MFIITLGQDHKFYTFNVYSSIHSSTPTKPEEMYVWMSIKMNASSTFYPTIGDDDINKDTTPKKSRAGQ